jgi:hypothetical protein
MLFAKQTLSLSLLQRHKYNAISRTHAGKTESAAGCKTNTSGGGGCDVRQFIAAARSRNKIGYYSPKKARNMSEDYMPGALWRGPKLLPGIILMIIPPAHTPPLNHIRIGICRFNCCGLQFT